LSQWAAVTTAHETAVDLMHQKRLMMDSIAVAETVDLTVIQNTYHRAYKAARSNRESVAAL
jgi:hypothetical protein